MSSVRLSNVLILVLFALFAGSHALRNVNLTIVPPVVNKSSSAVLYCDYDLEGAPLYSVKWYRGEKEFYRYTETEEVKVRVFDIDGFEVNVCINVFSLVILLLSHITCFSSSKLLMLILSSVSFICCATPGDSSHA